MISNLWINYLLNCPLIVVFKDNLLQSIFVPPTTSNHTTSTRVIPHSFKSGSPRPSTTSGVWPLTAAHGPLDYQPHSSLSFVPIHPKEQVPLFVTSPILLVQFDWPTFITHPEKHREVGGLCEPSWSITYRIMRGVAEERGEEATWVLSGADSATVWSIYPHHGSPNLESVFQL